MVLGPWSAVLDYARPSWWVAEMVRMVMDREHLLVSVIHARFVCQTVEVAGRGLKPLRSQVADAPTISTGKRLPSRLHAEWQGQQAD